MRWRRGTVIVLALLGGCAASGLRLRFPNTGAPPQASSTADPLAPIQTPRTAADRIVNGAKSEARRGVVYNASYRSLPYPGGDVPSGQGACTDVVIRALRAAGYDLQRLIHEDMARHFDLYPKSYSLPRPDPNIDHRRVPNQKAFLRRFGKALPLSTTGAAAGTWEPGDLVYWKLDSGRDHCGVLSDVRNADGLPLVIHNLIVAAQEDCLARWKITGHFRYPLDRD